MSNRIAFNQRDISAVGLSPSVTVETLADLKALNSRPESVLVKYGVTPGDGWGGVFRWTAGATTTHAAFVDSIEVEPTSGSAGRYIRQFDAGLYFPWFLPPTNDIDSAHEHLQNIIDVAFVLKGRVCYIPPTGTGLPYHIADTVTLRTGVTLRGLGGSNFGGTDVPYTDWTARGVWLRPSHASNICVDQTGFGSAIEDLNFIYDQATPDGGFTPTQFGKTISVKSLFSHISNVVIVGCWDGISYDYTTGGGTGVWMADIVVSAFGTAYRVDNANDNMYFRNWQQRNLWYMTDTDVADYLRANIIGADLGYCDNIRSEGYVCFQAKSGIHFRDGTVLGETHSAYNCDFAGTQFNLVTQTLTYEDATVKPWVRFGSTLAQSYSDFASITSTDELIPIASDNADISFAELRINNAGGKISTVGTGTGGRLHIGNLYVLNYSSALAAQVGITANAGATVSIGNIERWVKTAGSGAKFAGAGTFNLPVSVDASGNLVVEGSLGLYVPTGQTIDLGINSTSLVRLGGTALFPTTNNGISFGGTSNRINTVIATHGNFSGIFMNVAGTVQSLGSAGGTADALTATPNPALTSYSTMAFYLLKATADNATTTPTLNISGLGAKTIVKRASTALAAGDIVNGMILHLVYDGTNMQLLNPVTN